MARHRRKAGARFLAGAAYLGAAPCRENPRRSSTAGGETVGIRWPGHPFMQAVIRACGFPLAAPSANLSNQVSPTNAAHVQAQLGGRIPLIVDGGQSQVGIESTVWTSRCTRAYPATGHDSRRVAGRRGCAGCPRPGIRRDAGTQKPGAVEKSLRAQGKAARVQLADEADLRAQIDAQCTGGNRVHIVAHTQIPTGLAAASISVIPHDAAAFARALYAEFIAATQPAPKPS